MHLAKAREKVGEVGRLQEGDITRHIILCTVSAVQDGGSVSLTGLALTRNSSGTVMLLIEIESAGVGTKVSGSLMTGVWVGTAAVVTWPGGGSAGFGGWGMAVATARSARRGMEKCIFECLVCVFKYGKV